MTHPLQVVDDFERQLWQLCADFAAVSTERDNLRRENTRLAAQVAAYEAQWGTLYARRSSGL